MPKFRPPWLPEKQHATVTPQRTTACNEGVHAVPPSSSSTPGRFMGLSSPSPAGQKRAIFCASIRECLSWPSLYSNANCGHRRTAIPDGMRRQPRAPWATHMASSGTYRPSKRAASEPRDAAHPPTAAGSAPRTGQTDPTRQACRSGTDGDAGGYAGPGHGIPATHREGARKARCLKHRFPGPERPARKGETAHAHAQHRSRPHGPTPAPCIHHPGGPCRPVHRTARPNLPDRSCAPGPDGCRAARRSRGGARHQP